MRGGRGRAVVVLGATPSVVDTMDYFETATAGNAVDFGNASVARYQNGFGGMASGTRGVFQGGSPATNIMEYVTISSSGGRMISVIIIGVLQMVMVNVQMQQEDYWQVDI